MTEKRRKAIIKRRIFVGILAALLAIVVALLIVIITAISNSSDNDDSSSSNKASVSDSDNTVDNNQPSSSDASDDEPDQSKEPDYVTYGDITLDKNFSRLLLVNADNPLPDNYDANIKEDLVEIDPEYRNNDYVTQIHKDIYPYVEAMVKAAHDDGVDLRVWSPFRSYAIQKDLFQKQVDRVGGDEALAATVVARPGTSEHNTGLCADFNMASDTFESTPMFDWMMENAEDYGFILRYPADKQSITGVIYESWHWRFVGINNAKEMNELGLTLEEYVEQKGIDTKKELN